MLYGTLSKPRTMKEMLERCNTPLTKWQIMKALMTSDNRITINGWTCYLLRVAKEDGSGNCFNLTVTEGGKEYTSFVRCKE